MNEQTVKFLLVDDLEENLLALEALLRQDGLELIKARSGPEALDLLLTHDVGLALVDVQMSGMDGFEFAETVRSTERTKAIPIIFVTAGTLSPDQQFRGYEVGAVDFLVRPLNPHILRNKTRVFLELSRQRQELTRQRDELQESEERFKLIANSLPQLAWMARADGWIFWYNDRWYDYTGSTPDQMEGWGWEKAHDPAELPRVLATWRRACATGEPWEECFPLRRRDGTMRWHLTRALPLKDHSGRVLFWFGTNTDITDQRDSERAAREREWMVRLALDAAQMGTWIYTLADGVCELDEKAQELFGAPERKYRLDDETVRRMIHPDDIDAQRSAIEAACVPESDGRAHVEYRVITSEEPRWLSVFGRAEFEDAGNSRQAVRIVGTCRDITRRKKFEAEHNFLLESERSARAEAERASRLKDSFLATLSHELRSPLNVIIGWSQILLKGQADPNQAAEVILRNARTQQRLIEDLLDMSKIKSGKLDIATRPLQIVELVHSVVESEKPNAAFKGIRLRENLRCPECWIEGDGTRLQQVFWNLINNAVKFTPEGGEVLVSLARAGDRIEVRVSDSGQGIDSDFLPHLFERFRQEDSSHTRRHGGLGLGLALVKLITEYHRGTVKAESRGKGLGSTFTVSLPVLAAADSDSEPTWSDGRQHRTPLPTLEGRSIAVVDDDPDALAFVARILEDRGANVRCFGSADAAFSGITEEAPDLVLSDIGMPDKDGYTLGREIRAIHSRLPIIALTAFARPEDRRKVLSAGFNAHLPKPVDVPLLLRTVAENLDGVGTQLSSARV